MPVLVYSFTAHGFPVEVLTQMAVGTSLATIVFTSVNSIIEHHRRGAVRWPVFLWMTVGILVGSALGAVTAAKIQGPILQKIIGTFAILVSIQMTFGLQPRAAGTLPGRTGLGLAGGVVGWASAIFGIGGGSLTVPFLSWRGVPMQQAVATSAACGLPIAIAGALSFIAVGWHNAQLPELSFGFVYLPALVGIAATSMIFARFGARLAHRLPPKVLKRLFALLLFCIGLSFLI
ncbi:hypothetical protein D3C76_492400 [compost metagenome]